MARQPPRPETRENIERSLDVGRHNRGLTRTPGGLREEAMIRHLANLRDKLDPVSFAQVQSQFLRGSHRLAVEARRKRRRPDEGGMPALVEPPRGPRPFAGGAAAPLEFD